MNIHEYQAKYILKSHGIPVPNNVLITSVAEGKTKKKQIGLPLVIKAQVHAGGRGKAGAIKLVKTDKEFEENLERIFHMTVKGLRVEKVLLEEAVNIDKQFYFGIIVDRIRQLNVVMASAEGGIEIEEVAKNTPQKILTHPLPDLNKINSKDIEKITSFLGLKDKLLKEFQTIFESCIKAYINTDAQLLEINPLVLTQEKHLMACDAKVILDDNGLSKHTELTTLKDEAEDNPLEKEAHQKKLAYVKLKGNIGIIGNGAGLVMATMDEVKRAGGQPANFLDIGGGAKQDIMQDSLGVLFQDNEVQGIFINVFGGITRCDEVANGIIEVLKDKPKDIPIVLRLAGTRAEEGNKILKNSSLIPALSMEEGAKKIVSLIKS